MSYSGAMKKKLLAVIMLTISCLSLPVNAEFEVEVDDNLANCSGLVNILKHRWFDVKHHMEPMGGKVGVPRNEDFQCIDRIAVRSALEKKIVTTADIKCYSPFSSQGLGVCCDNPVQNCARLNPALFPELVEKQKSRNYERTKPDWVRPPSDSDQWSSNE